jgi:hypothetical protein
MNGFAEVFGGTPSVIELPKFCCGINTGCVADFMYVRSFMVEIRARSNTE